MKYWDIPDVAEMIAPGDRQVANTLRGWIRQERITGAKQREPNAKFWIPAEGVADAWQLWAKHKELDPETEMPVRVRQITARAEPPPASMIAGEPIVTVLVPQGVAVKVVQAA